MSNFLTLLSNQPQVVLFRNQAFYFTRSGAIDLNTGSVRLVGINSNAWSRTVFTNVHHAYDSALNAQNIYASAYDVYWFGFFARCLTDRL